MSEDDRNFLEHYLEYSTIDRTGKIYLDLISLALESRGDTVIIPLQDYMGLGSEARINTPSTVGDNWEWRVKEEQLDEDLKETIRTLTEKYRTRAQERSEEERKKKKQKRLRKKKNNIQKNKIFDGHDFGHARFLCREAYRERSIWEEESFLRL